MCVLLHLYLPGPKQPEPALDQILAPEMDGQILAPEMDGQTLAQLEETEALAPELDGHCLALEPEMNGQILALAQVQLEETEVLDQTLALEMDGQ